VRFLSLCEAKCGRYLALAKSHGQQNVNLMRWECDVTFRIGLDWIGSEC
jgi:hypothetical protein